MTSILSAISFWWLFLLHPLHVSVTEIEYDEKDKALEIMMRVFSDDLELAMRKYYKIPDLDILKPQAGSSVDQMMTKYLQENFSVMLDNRNQPFTLLGNENEGDAFVFYIEVPKIKKWKTLKVRNSVLMDTHDDQSNLVHVTVGEEVKSLRLTKNNATGDLTF